MRTLLLLNLLYFCTISFSFNPKKTIFTQQTTSTQVINKGNEAIVLQDEFKSLNSLTPKDYRLIKAKRNQYQIARNEYKSMLNSFDLSVLSISERANINQISSDLGL